MNAPVPFSLPYGTMRPEDLRYPYAHALAEMITEATRLVVEVNTAHADVKAFCMDVIAEMSALRGRVVEATKRHERVLQQMADAFDGMQRYLGHAATAADGAFLAGTAVLDAVGGKTEAVLRGYEVRAARASKELDARSKALRLQEGSAQSELSALRATALELECYVKEVERYHASVSSEFDRAMAVSRTSHSLWRRVLFAFRPTALKLRRLKAPEMPESLRQRRQSAY